MARRSSTSTGFQKEPLDWSRHLIFLLSFLIVFIIYTVVAASIYPVLRAGDKVVQTAMYGLLAALQVIILVTIQSILDVVIEDTSSSITSRLRVNIKGFGLRKRERNPVAAARDLLLLLFCALVPMDMATYAIPGVLEFVARSGVGMFFSGMSFPVFLVIGITWNLITGVKEEFVFRGYFLNRLNEKGRPHSAWLVSSLVFGLLHVNPAHLATFPAGPVTWFASATLAGLLFAGYVLATGRIVVAMLAHGLANVISSVPVWFFHENGGVIDAGMQGFVIMFYLPMLAAGLVLAIAWRGHVRAARLNAKYAFIALARKTTAMDWVIMLVVVTLTGLTGMLGIIAF